jgi:hypothetical protein
LLLICATSITILSLVALLFVVVLRMKTPGWLKFSARLLPVPTFTFEISADVRPRDPKPHEDIAPAHVGHPDSGRRVLEPDDIPRGYGSSMNVFTIGADIGAMIIGVPVVAAGFLWIGRWRAARKQRKAATELRNWSGYVLLGGISNWYVRLVEDPQTLSSRVVLEVIDRDGKPDPGWASNLRGTVKRDGQLARVPKPEEYDFLKYLHKERGYGKGFPVGWQDENAESAQFNGG